MFGIDAHDELTQEPVLDPAWRESYWLDLLDREQGIGVLLYLGVQPLERHGYGLVHVADREGAVLFQERDFGVTVGSHEPGRPQIDVGDFAVRLDRPLQGQSIRFARNGSELALAFQSDAVIYDYPWEWTRSRHYEQLGWATATARLDGAEPLQLSGPAARDHAWGLRGLRPWRHWLWVTGRGEPGEPRWSACWVEDDERTQLLGHLVDEDGGAHTLRRLEAELGYVGGAPSSARLELTFGRGRRLSTELELFGQVDLSKADAHKQGGYYFAFAESERAGGTFDVFWRSDLEPPTRVVADAE